MAVHYVPRQNIDKKKVNESKTVKSKGFIVFLFNIELWTLKVN